MFKLLEEEDMSLQVQRDTRLETYFFQATTCLGNQGMNVILQTLHLLLIFALKQVTEHPIMVISSVNQSLLDSVVVSVSDFLTVSKLYVSTVSFERSRKIGREKNSEMREKKILK